MTTRTALRIPADLPGSGWYDLLDPPPPPRVLEGAETADWIVVGGGFAGLAAVRRLTQLRPRDKVVLLDAQRIGFGAAGRNSGFMIDLPHNLASESYGTKREKDLAEICRNRAGIAFAREAADEYGFSAGIFDPSGKFHGATNGHGIAALRAFERQLQALGEPFTSLDAGDMKRITGTSYYAGGSFMPGTVIIQPAAFVRGVAQGLSAKAIIYENSAAVRIATGAATHTVHTARGRVTAPRLILTVNGHLESFGFFARKFMHIFLYGSMTRQLSATEVRALGGEPAWALIPADPMGSTVRRLREDRILVRNTFTWNSQMATTPAQIARIGRNHDASFRARFPMLPDVTMEHRWGGHLCLSLNSVPVFGEIAERLFVAGCCNGLGTVKGTLHGKLIAEVACGETSPMAEDVLAEPKPQRLYPEPFMTAGANARLWWMQKRAGADF